MIAFSPDSCVLFAASSDDTGGRTAAAGASSSLAGTASPLPPAGAGFAAATDAGAPLASPLSPTKVSSLLVSSSGAVRPESDREREPKAIRGKKKGERSGAEEKKTIFIRLSFACRTMEWKYGGHTSPA